MEAHVPHIQRHSTISPLYPRMQNCREYILWGPYPVLRAVCVTSFNLTAALRHRPLIGHFMPKVTQLANTKAAIGTSSLSYYILQLRHISVIIYRSQLLTSVLCILFAAEGLIK